MKITPVCRDVNFGRMLNNEELKEYEKVLEQGKKSSDKPEILFLLCRRKACLKVRK